MSIRTKTILATVVALVALIAVLDIAMVIIIGRTFGDMETREAKASAVHGSNVVKGVTTTLAASIYDWAVWDDTYAFIQDKNNDYVQSNLSNAAIAAMHLNLMIYYDHAGRQVLAKAVNIDSQASEPLPADFCELVQSDSRFLNHDTPESEFKGIVLTKNGPLIFSTHAITDSSQKAPPKGTLVFGRYLNGALVSKLSKDYELSLRVSTLDNAQMPADFAQACKQISAREDTCPVIPLSEDRIASYSVIDDALGKPALIVRVDAPRDIHKQSAVMVRYTTIGLIIAGLAFALLNSLWLYFTVIKRITQLDAYVKGAISELGLG